MQDNNFIDVFSNIFNILKDYFMETFVTLMYYGGGIFYIIKFYALLAFDEIINFFKNS
jgi:hypothetical protein